MKTFSEKQVEELSEILLNTASSIESGLNQMGFEIEECDFDTIEDRLADYIELCQGCEWWHEPGELVGVADDDEPGYCDQCRK